MAKIKRGIGVMILSLIVFISPAMLSFGNITPLLSSLTFLPLYLPSLSQIFFQMRHIFLVATLDPLVAALDSPVDFSVQPLDILNPFPSSSFNEQVEDEQVKDELPNPELGSPTPTPLEDLAQDIPPHHSTRVRSIPAHLLDNHCYTALLHYTSLTPIVGPLLTLYDRLQWKKNLMHYLKTIFGIWWLSPLGNLWLVVSESTR